MMRSLEVPLEIMSMKIVVAVLCSPFGHNMRHDSWIKGHLILLGMFHIICACKIYYQLIKYDATLKIRLTSNYILNEQLYQSFYVSIFPLMCPASGTFSERIHLLPNE